MLVPISWHLPSCSFLLKFNFTLCPAVIYLNEKARNRQKSDKIAYVKIYLPKLELQS